MKCTLLTKDEVCQNQSCIFKKYGTNAAVTDFSLLLGLEVSNDHTSDSLYYKDREFTDTRAADYWTRTKENDKVIVMSSYSFGYNSPKKLDYQFIGIRPVLKYSDIRNEINNIEISDKEVLEVQYGEYPQTICDEKINLEIEKKYKEGKILKTEKKYTINSKESEIFFPQELNEYIYNNKKYIRFIADRDIIRTKLSNKKYIEYSKAYWIKVEPIIWMIDEDKDIAVSKKILITGIPFDKYYSGIFEETNMYNYLNNYFIKEIKTKKKKKQKNKLDDIEEKIENMSLEELQQLRFIIENQIKKEVKIKRKGGII